MRLLNVRTLHLEHFDNDDTTPPYATLSHAWGPAEQEISFQDMSKTKRSIRHPIRGGRDSALSKKLAWTKVKGACREAQEYCDYIWIDTICIDKTSSSELQEAINSMFRWYENSLICLTYLEDVRSADQNPKEPGSDFRMSRWFSRAWTLQELLAPAKLIFFDRSWAEIGSKEELSGVIEEITGIQVYYIWAPFDVIAAGQGVVQHLARASIAERMSWAAERQATRKEDVAYCLLGIFDIHMPMLYGEGARAFLRLQEEIMKKESDDSLLCWGYREPYDEYQLDQPSILAPHPLSFKHCRNITSSWIDGFPQPTFAVNQRGLLVHLPVKADETHAHVVYLILGCKPKSSEPSKDGTDADYLVIPLISARTVDIPKRTSVWHHDEYLRPTWCRPTAVSKAFLSGAKSTQLTILRLAGRDQRPLKNDYYFRRLPFTMNVSQMDLSQKCSVLGTYPPQPLSAQSIILSEYPSHHQSSSATSQTDLETSIASLCSVNPGSNENNESNMIDSAQNGTTHSEEGQRMVHIKLDPIGGLLIVFDYLAAEAKGRFLHTLKCRAFDLPGDFPLELLYDLSMTRDFSQLQELVSSCSPAEEERHLFQLCGALDSGKIGVLNVRFERPHPSAETYITISVLDSDSLSDSKMMEAKRRKNVMDR